MSTTGPLLPSPTVVQGFFRTLLDKPVSAAIAKPPPAILPIVGTYLDDTDAIRALWGFDFALGNFAGAALSLMQPAEAAKFAASKRLVDTLAENLAEVANIGANLMNAPGGVHLRFRSLLLTGVGLPPALGALLLRPKDRLDLTVTIPSYGTGAMCIVVQR